jgi:hypothetical protein
MYSMGHVVRHSQAPAIQPAVSDTHGLEDFRTPSSDIKLSRFAVKEENSEVKIQKIKLQFLNIPQN